MTPFKGTNRVTSPFGPRRSPIYGTSEMHKGEDIVTAGVWPGDAWKVREVTGGKVLRVTGDQWRGNYVDVQTAPGVFERYQHMHLIYVAPGQDVPQGTVLGMAGKTGDSTGVHLHFEAQKNGVAVNPAAWSDIPNALGTYPGNDNLDGAGPVVPSPSEPGAGRALPFEGIDISKYQGKVDWPKVRAAGITAAWVRIGWAGYDGEIYWKTGSPGCDPDFHTNMRGAIDAGLDVGVYLYSYVQTSEMARLSIRNAKKYASSYKLTLPFAWDFEESSQYFSYGKDVNTSICHAALDEISLQGYVPILYTYTNFANAYLDINTLPAAYDVWIADYREKLGFKGKYTVWQYTSTGSVPGVNGSVDRNRIYKDYPALIGGGTKNPMYALTIGPLSLGDKDSGVRWAEGLGLPYMVEEVT